jgi:MarR family transcriptional regulator, negative regulator of the multidrug operon emrRAB
MHDIDRTANLLGATALAVDDLLLSAVTRTAGTSASGAAALVVLSASNGLSVTELGRRVGLSQPAAARMVESLETDDLVQRRWANPRWVSVRLTRRGRQAARRLLAARRTPLAEVVEALDPADRDALAEVLERVLARLYARIGSSELICRLCDRGRCTTDAVCPVGAAERAAAR